MHGSGLNSKELSEQFRHMMQVQSQKELYMAEPFSGLFKFVILTVLSRSFFSLGEIESTRWLALLIVFCGLWQ